MTILGHAYQRDEIVQYADFVGDSFQLAQQSLKHPEAEFVVFCGVHFMAETADLLTTDDQPVILPNLAAGCSMADMADIDAVQACWDQLAAVYGTEPDADGRVPVVPVTYMNSAASLKGFCGAHGGIVCTSSNAREVLEWAFERGQRVLFFPDQHLGRNTAKAMGVAVEDMPLWDPRKPRGGNSEQDLLDARVVLWRGWCSVHQRFTVDQIAQARAKNPDVRVVVHPECPMEVVDAADEAGSTRYIQLAVDAAPAGTAFAIGTEVNMVRRLADTRPDLTIECLDPGRLPVLDDVPDPPGLPGVGAGVPRRGPRREPGQRRRRGRGQRPHGGGADAGGRRVSPAAEVTTDVRTDVLVVGAGVAGLTAALEAARGGRVVLATKTTLGEGSTAYAQGGIAAATGPDDVAAHVGDTLAAGAGLSSPAAAQALCAAGPAAVRVLAERGVAFDRSATAGAGWALGLEAAHSRPRILHAGGDRTGAAVSQALAEAVRRSDVDVREDAFLLGLLTSDGRVTGAEFAVGPARGGTRTLLRVHSGAVVLATGGAGQLYSRTTNPAVATADGLAAAFRAGALVADLEFFQFHPTVAASTRRSSSPRPSAARAPSCATPPDGGSRSTPIPGASSPRATWSPAPSPPRWRARAAPRCCSTRPGSPRTWGGRSPNGSRASRR